MNQLQVLKKLIPIYTEAINRIADGEDEIMVTNETYTGWGICYCSRHNRIAEIYHNEWVDELGAYWYNMPNDDFKETIECLSYRLTIMQLMVMDINQTT